MPLNNPRCVEASHANRSLPLSERQTEQLAARSPAKVSELGARAITRTQWLLVQQEVWFAITAIAVALATGSVVFVEQCRQRDQCLAASRCMRLSALVGCAFVTAADAAALGYYGNSSVVCAPGEAYDPVSTGCVLLRPFPDALNTEAFGDRSASASCSEAACGAWLRGGSVPAQQTEVYMSAAMHNSFVQTATDLLIDVASRPQLTASVMAATIQRCKVDSHNGASGLRASSRRAYAALARRIDAAPNAAAGAGALASGGCASIANPGVFLLANGLQLRLADDVLINSHHFQTRTSSVGAPDNTAVAAAAMLDRMNVEMRQHVLSTEIDDYLRGYFGTNPVPTLLNPNPVIYSAATYYFPAYLAAAQALPDNWRPLLHAMSASCAVGLEASLPTVSMPYSTRAVSARPIRSRRLPPAFLHHAPPEHHDHHHLSDKQELARMANASFRSIEHVAYELTSASSLSSTNADCVALGLTFHPEETKSILFDRIVGDRLYKRLQPIVETLRAGVLAAMDGPVARAMFNSTAAVRSCVNTTLVRIPGAPRGKTSSSNPHALCLSFNLPPSTTEQPAGGHVSFAGSWAGRSVAEPHAEFDSQDTVFEMVVKQASALLRERVEAVMTSTTLAEHWIKTTPTARNAFIFALADGGFQLLYHGMLVPPYASPHYSDRSLAMRVGAMIAHEFAHCSTLLPEGVWHSAGVRATLAGYMQSTYVEAMADVIGVSGVLESGVVDWPTMRDHWGQLWCSRRSASWEEPTDGSHPSSLRRADELAKVIDRFY